jgi:hypothetical protein
MSIELQIRSAVFKEFIGRTVQERLFTTCFSPFEFPQATIYIDHLDVGQADIQIIQVDSAIELRIPIDVYLVERQSILSAPNTVPLGANAKVGTPILICEMVINKTVLELRYKDFDPGPLGAVLNDGLPMIQDAIRNAIGSLASLDLDASLKAISPITPSSSDVVLTANNIAIRFDPDGAAVDRTIGSQIWGLFLDASTAESMISNSVQQPDMTTTPHWRPRGTTPVVEMDFFASRPLPDPLSGHGDAYGKIGCEMSVLPSTPPNLRILVNWSLDRIELYTELLDRLGIFVKDAVEAIAKPLIETEIKNQFDPANFGGMKLDDHNFLLDTPLPDLSFGAAVLEYSSILASPEGMTLGGNVYLPADPGSAMVDPNVNPFSQLNGRPVFGCRSYVSKTARINEVTSSASVWMQDGGSICAWEVISPSFSISRYITSDGTMLYINLPALMILKIFGPVLVLLQTPRGVRLIDLGLPPQPVLNNKGEVINVNIDYIDTCKYIPIEQWKWLTGQFSKPVIQQGSADGPGNPVPPPGDWAEYLNGLQAFGMQLITLTDLNPGELIQFQSHHQVINVTANKFGQAIVPTLLPFVGMRQEIFTQGALTRVNRLSLQGHVTLDTVIFERQVNLTPSQSARLETAEDIAIVTTRNMEQFDRHEIGPLGVMKLQSSSFETAVVSEDLVHDEANTTQRHLRGSVSNLPGVAEIFRVPGFADAAVALAVMTDGNTLILDLTEPESVRVSGTMAGPMGNLEISNEWAAATGSGRTIVYRVSRL